MKRTSWRIAHWLSLTLLFTSSLAAAERGFNGIGVNMGNLFRLSEAKTRSISPENFSGEKGSGGMAVDSQVKQCARDLGQGW